MQGGDPVVPCGACVVGPTSGREKRTCPFFASSWLMEPSIHWLSQEPDYKEIARERALQG